MDIPRSPSSPTPSSSSSGEPSPKKPAGRSRIPKLKKRIPQPVHQTSTTKSDSSTRRKSAIPAKRSRATLTTKSTAENIPLTADKAKDHFSKCHTRKGINDTLRKLSPEKTESDKKTLKEASDKRAAFLLAKDILIKSQLLTADKSSEIKDISEDSKVEVTDKNEVKKRTDYVKTLKLMHENGMMPHNKENKNIQPFTTDKKPRKIAVLQKSGIKREQADRAITDFIKDNYGKDHPRKLQDYKLAIEIIEKNLEKGNGESVSLMAIEQSLEQVSLIDSKPPTVQLVEHTPAEAAIISAVKSEESDVSVQITTEEMLHDLGLEGTNPSEMKEKCRKSLKTGSRQQFIFKIYSTGLESFSTYTTASELLESDFKKDSKEKISGQLQRNGSVKPTKDLFKDWEKDKTNKSFSRSDISPAQKNDVYYNCFPQALSLLMTEAEFQNLPQPEEGNTEQAKKVAEENKRLACVLAVKTANKLYDRSHLSGKTLPLLTYNKLTQSSTVKNARSVAEAKDGLPSLSSSDNSGKDQFESDVVMLGVALNATGSVRAKVKD